MKRLIAPFAAIAFVLGIHSAGRAQVDPSDVWTVDPLPLVPPASAQAQDPFVRQVLAVHNAARAEVGVGPLRWNAGLAADAQVWAQHLAQTGEFEHDDQGDDEKNEGENLFEGTRGAFGVARMVGYWVDEKSDFQAGRFPDVARDQDWESVGHYTQIVWRDTGEVGCAIGRNREDDVLVCRYSQPGNVEGERVF